MEVYAILVRATQTVLVLTVAITATLILGKVSHLRNYITTDLRIERCFDINDGCPEHVSKLKAKQY